MSVRINFNEATKSWKNKIKKKIKERLYLIQTELLSQHGLKFEKIEIACIGNEIIQNRIEDFKCEILINRIDDYVPIQKVIYIKDKKNISDATYRSLLDELKLKIPTLYELKKEIKICDQLFNIMENSKGVYLNIQEKLKMLIPKIKKNFSDQITNILHIKFSADGAQIIKRKSILNLTFTVLNEGKIAETANGNYTCGLFDISNEDYETMSVCLDQIKNEINNLRELEMNGLKYKIETYIGGDLKMLAITYGINHANSNCPCIWCIWDKRKLINTDINKVVDEIKREWSILDQTKGARTVEDSLVYSGRNGYVNIPLFRIPFHRIYIDMLHLFLRITDILYDLFFRDLREIDGKQNNQIDMLKQPHLNHFFSYLSETFKIRRPYYIDGKTIKIRDLQGPEKKKVFNEIDLRTFAQDNVKVIKINELWKDFMLIFNRIKSEDISKEYIKTKTKAWLLSFSDLYDASHITPYMHCFGNHLHEFVDLYGAVNKFNLEGLEKLNHLTHSHVFRATNMHSNYLTQILKKRNRIEVSCRE